MIRLSQKNSKETTHDNRTKTLAAVIFLFSFAIIARLFNVQVLSYDVYAARALQQHGVERDILPNRGRIFVGIPSEASGLYPLAANKEFALVYAVPQEISNPEQAAETLAPVLYPLTHEELDKAKILAAAEQSIREQLFEKVMAQAEPSAGVEVVVNEEEVAVALDKERLVMEERWEKDAEESMKAYQDELMAVFSKARDPYEPLVKKVDK